MKLIGITRIRNEEKVIGATLDHVSALVDGVVVYDDCSTDRTVQICEQHPIVKKVLRGTTWETDGVARNKAEGTLRQAAYEEAVRLGADWVYCFDADEYIEFEGIDFKAGAYYFRLFDFYITPEDVETPYLERRWMGPEYRDIVMLYRVNNKIRFFQREPRGVQGPLEFGGWVKHYGKAITVEEWEQTCDYYINHLWRDVKRSLWQRWVERQGKAIHTKSDFGRPLIEWKDRKHVHKVVKLIG